MDAVVGRRLTFLSPILFWIIFDCSLPTGWQAGLEATKKGAA